MEIQQACHQSRTILHLEGSSIFEALTKHNISPVDIVNIATTLTFSFPSTREQQNGVFLLGPEDIMLKLKAQRNQIPLENYKVKKFAYNFNNLMEKAATKIPEVNQLAQKFVQELKKLSYLDVLDFKEGSTVLFKLKTRDLQSGSQLLNYLEYNNILVEKWDDQSNTFKIVFKMFHTESDYRDLLKYLQVFFDETCIS